MWGLHHISTLRSPVFSPLPNEIQDPETDRGETDGGIWWVGASFWLPKKGVLLLCFFCEWFRIIKKNSWKSSTKFDQNCSSFKSPKSKIIHSFLFVWYSLFFLYIFFIYLVFHFSISIYCRKKQSEYML